MTLETTPVNRRRLLGGVIAAATVGSIGSPFGALGARAAANPSSIRRAPGNPPNGTDYGPLQPVSDQATGLPLLLLPAGFEYISYGWTNDPLNDGTPTPAAHDGMAAYRDGDLVRLVRLVRNHERGNGAPFAAPAVYDAASAGGTTNLTFDPDGGQWLESYGSLTGTIRNCAGGPTPWASWLTCEETTQINGAGTPAERRHGYVFDVPSTGASDAVALKGLGRFSHEAVAVDPATGIVYLTEDATPSGFYRFVPSTPGDLTAGKLQMMAIDGKPDLYRDTTGASFAVTSWVDIDNPDPGVGETSTVQQGLAKGGTAITRGEGAWYGAGATGPGNGNGQGNANGRGNGNGVGRGNGNGGSGTGDIYFISTSGGPVGQGQVFDYDPVADTVTVLFASPGSATLNAPDNVCVSPRGGLVLCEDGGGNEFLHGLTLDGTIFQFAMNNVDLTGGTAGKNVTPGNYMGSEWCGACFEPAQGNWMFANLQSPGITFAITGPWRKGAL